MWDRCSNCDPTTQVKKKHAPFVSKNSCAKNNKPRWPFNFFLLKYLYLLSSSSSSLMRVHFKTLIVPVIQIYADLFQCWRTSLYNQRFHHHHLLFFKPQTITNTWIKTRFTLTTLHDQDQQKPTLDLFLLSPVIFFSFTTTISTIILSKH